MNLKIINPIECPHWEDQLLDQREPTVFQTSNWAKVLKSSYGYSPVYCTVEQDGLLSALLPVMEVRSVLTGCRGVSIPFTDYCDVLAEENVFRMLINRVVEQGKKSGWSYLELRGGQNHFGTAPAFESFYRHTLELRDDKREMLAGFRNSTVRNIKKAVESLNGELLVTTSRRTSSAVDDLLKREFSDYPRCRLLVIANEKNFPRLY